MTKKINMPKEYIEAVERFKETSFYKEYVEKVYYCEEEPDIIYFKNKKGYTKKEEEACSLLVGIEFILYDLEYLEKNSKREYIVKIEEI